MSALVDIADAVAASINARTFDPPITAERSHLPIFDLGRVGDAIQVSVVQIGRASCRERVSFTV